MATRMLSTGRTISEGAYHAFETVATWSPTPLYRRTIQFLWPAHISSLHCLIRLWWLPFWAGADVAAPQFRSKPAPFAGTSDAALRFRGLLAATRRRQLVIRFATLALRAITLTLLIAIVWTALTLSGRGDIDRSSIQIAFAVLVGLAMAFAWHYRPTLRDTARMLDHSFELSDRMTTAYDVAATGPGSRSGSPNLAYLQIVDATNTLAMLERHPILRVRPPWREGVLAAGLAMIFLSLFLLNGTGTPIQPVAQARVPVFVPAADRLQQQAPLPDQSALPELYKPTVGEVQERADLSAAAEHDLLQIADALEDNSLTSPITDAIRAGNYEQAAEALRELAPEIAGMNQADKDVLADELDSAADAMSGEHPGLRQTTERAADGLRGNPEQAEESLQDLSDSISETGNQVADQTELADQMREARENEATGSVQDSSGSRPDAGDSDVAGDTTEGNPAGEGSDAAGGQQTDTSSGTSDTTAPGSSNGSTSDQQPSSGSDQDGSSSDSAGSQSSSSGGSGSSASGDSSAGDNVQASGDGGGANGGDSNQLEGSSSGTAGDVQTTGGSGAGAGEGQNDSQNSSNGTQARPGTGTGDTPDPNVTGGSGTGTTSDALGEQTTGTTITLTRAPGTEGQRTGGSSTSSTGSGAGVAAGAGGTDQGDVGTAGPDSNRVPQEYRPIVEDYFSDGP